MKLELDKLRFFSVIVNNGSGCLFQPETSEYSFVLTAKHLIKENKSVKVIREQLINGQLNKEEFIGQAYIHTNNEIDAAIIKIPKVENLEELSIIDAQNNSGKGVTFLFGYPEKRRPDEEKYRNDEVRILNSRVKNYIEIETLQNSVYAEIEGLSGGGVITIENGSYYLAGIQKRMAKEDEQESLGRLVMMPIKFFDEIIEHYSLAKLKAPQKIKSKLTKQLMQHTESILTPIHSNIKFKENEIKIDRSSIFSNLKDELKTHQIIILYGEGGVGKTAIIKEFYNQLDKNNIPFFLFKASEFKNSNLLFYSSGNFSLAEFMEEYNVISEKYIVIDSAENLPQEREFLLEFLSTVISNKWKLIFTTRYAYLDDLRDKFILEYRIPFHSFHIEKIKIEELKALATLYNFHLPKNEKLIILLQYPFYLKEYLQNYNDSEIDSSVSVFINKLWKNQIAKPIYSNSKSKREECFLSLVSKKVEEGIFFVQADNCDYETLTSLEHDEIIKFETNAGGYFITHDIYEEWGLQKIIERKFSNLQNYEDFFMKLDSSLPMRRAFRNWLSEKILNEMDSVKLLIENSLLSNEIASYWRDEILVSVFLSDFSEKFFLTFENKLFENEQTLLVKIIFLLKIACKQIDEQKLHLFGLNQINNHDLKYLITKPKGSGWDNTIDFIYKHKEKINYEHINIILSLLEDWVNVNKAGVTTKKAGQLALYYYLKMKRNSEFRYRLRDESEQRITIIILAGAHEIKDELNAIFDKVVSKKRVSYSETYYYLIKEILSSSTNNLEVLKEFPNKVLQLADLFWFQIPEKEGRFGSHSMGVEEYFSISDKHDFSYFPSSAYQTPIFLLLGISTKATLDFILSFTNKTIESYAKSGLDGAIQEVEVFMDNTKTIKQFISPRIYGTYRGANVSTHLLESIHMALEKWLLNGASNISKEILENICIYLISNSRSASITAVVASLVLAQPSKLFNIAKVLFRTKEFFDYDNHRQISEYMAKSTYSIGYGLNYRTRIFEDERLKTCEEEHRKLSLERIAFYYQLYKYENESDEDVKARQEVIWGIIDKYYEELKSEESESTNTWKMSLARMDRRKMRTDVEEKNGQTIVSLTPEIEPELKSFSDEKLDRVNEVNKFLKLKIWSTYRFNREENQYKEYQNYESNPALALVEIKEILDKLNQEDENNFSLLNKSIPAYACSVLIRDFIDSLSGEDRIFCKEVILDFASMPLRYKNYFYQVSDGIEPAILSLPILVRFCSPDEKENIKILLFLLLMSPSPRISPIVCNAIYQNMWELNSTDADSILIGYLLLKPKFNNFIREERKRHYSDPFQNPGAMGDSKIFYEANEGELQKIIKNDYSYNDIVDIENIDLNILITAFELIPLKTKNKDHINFLNSIFPLFSIKLFLNLKNDRTYELRARFLKKYSIFILTHEKEFIEFFIKPFIDNFHASKETAELFQSLISEEDRLNQYENFWFIWNGFYPAIIREYKNKFNSNYSEQLIKNYLLAWPYWRSEATEWHSLKEREKVFYKKIIEDIGHIPSVLYSVAKILNSIGSSFLSDGIQWISVLIQKNNEYDFNEIEKDTIYYLEIIIKKYILKNREYIRKQILIKNQVIVILNFLVKHGSIVAYMLREDIL